jgi:hypothetical protein
MDLFISGKERNISEVSEVVIETWNTISSGNRVQRFSGPQAIRAIESIFKLPALDFRGVSVSALATGRIVISLQSGCTEEYSILNDRLAKSVQKSGVAYNLASPSNYSQQ